MSDEESARMLNEAEREELALLRKRTMNQRDYIIKFGHYASGLEEKLKLLTMNPVAVIPKSYPSRNEWSPHSLMCDHCGGDAIKSADGMFTDGDGEKCGNCGLPGHVSADSESEAYWQMTSDDFATCNDVTCIECSEIRRSKEVIKSVPTFDQERNAIYSAHNIGIQMCVTIASMYAAQGRSAEELYKALLKAQADQKEAQSKPPVIG